MWGGGRRLSEVPMRDFNSIVTRIAQVRHHPYFPSPFYPLGLLLSDGSQALPVHGAQRAVYPCTMLNIVLSPCVWECVWGAQALDVMGYLRASAKPLVIFGHSFGSMLAYHVCRRLRDAPYSFTPHYLIVSGGQPLDVSLHIGYICIREKDEASRRPCSKSLEYRATPTLMHDCASLRVGLPWGIPRVRTAESEHVCETGRSIARQACVPVPILCVHVPILCCVQERQSTGVSKFNDDQLIQYLVDMGGETYQYVSI